MKKQLVSRRLPLKLLIAGIIIFAGFYFIAGYFKKALRCADYFKIKEIIVRPGKAVDTFDGAKPRLLRRGSRAPLSINPEQTPGFSPGSVEWVDFSYLKGRYIFSIDLEKESRRILESYPSCRKVKLVRVLPDRLFADFLERQPVALVKLYRYFYVDKDAVFFEASSQQQDPDLPFISGLEKKSFALHPGKRYNFKELSLALSIIKAVRLSQVLKDYKLRRVDVADYNNASFFISTTAPRILEVKAGEGDISGKMNILGNLLEQLKNDLGRIKYIDLRFKDPVIKFNEEKNVR